jgi:ribonuclease BN (tRNA processing enzyme)
MPLPRREFLARCGITALALGGWGTARAEPASRTRLILLGTAGGPTPKRMRSAPAQVVLVDDDAYVVDCGDGVARQMVLAGVPLERMRALFITHQHSDHNAGYGSLLLFAWLAGLKMLDTYGPPPLVQMTDLVAQLHAYDIETRVRDEGRAPFAGLVRAHEVTAAGVVMERGGVKVTAAVVDHPPVRPAFAYRFDTPDRSIVVSGDTAPSQSLVALARGADVLVHEALYAPAIDRLVENEPHALRLRQHLLASHTPTSEVGRIAAAAGVKTLVLTHFVPGDDSSITDEMWSEGVRAHFKGTVVVGKDLMVL